MLPQKGYLYAELNIYDSETFYLEYMPRIKPILQQYGARFLVAANEPRLAGGDRQIGRVILLEFESMARAEAFCSSEDYQKLAKFGYETAATNLYIMPGIAN